jgi:FMN reductase
VTIRLLGIGGSPSRGSRTAAVIRLVLEEAAAADPAVETELFEVAAHGLAFCDGRPPERYEGETRRSIDRVAAADAYVVGSPMYRGSYTGALKNLFDLLPNDALAGKVCGLVATGGSDHHFLALEHQLRPLLSFFRAHTLPGTVYAQTAQFGRDGTIVDAGLQAQCRRLGRGLVALHRAIAAAGAAGPDYPRIPQRPDQQP